MSSTTAPIPNPSIALLKAIASSLHNLPNTKAALATMVQSLNSGSLPTPEQDATILNGLTEFTQVHHRQKHPEPTHAPRMAPAAPAAVKPADPAPDAKP